MARLFCSLLACVALLRLAVVGAGISIDGAKTTYQILKEGLDPGPTVEVGDTVTVHATGTVRQTGKKFWSTKDPGQQPFTYTAGGGVIKGWDMGARGMRKKEVRMLKIPADEGYGAGGFPAWGIPPGGDLDFELEVLKIKGKDGKKKKKKVSSKDGQPKAAPKEL